jgi:hypothetical protein
MAQQSINVSSYLKCPLAGAELVHDAAQGPHVRLGVVGPPLTQLCKWRSCDRYVSERRCHFVENSQLILRWSHKDNLDESLRLLTTLQNGAIVTGMYQRV